MTNTASTASTLADLCEPVFAEVCELRLAGGASDGSAPAEAAARIGRAVDAAAREARLSPSLDDGFRRFLPDLLFFVDYAMGRRFPEWHSLAEERMGIVAGEELFCCDLEKVLEDGTGERRELLRAMRICVDLGFSGAEAVGVERWRQCVDELARLVPAARPESPNGAGKVPASPRGRTGRRTSGLMLLFFCLSLCLVTLVAWRLWRAPALYRERAAFLWSVAGEPAAGTLIGGRSVPGKRGRP